FRPEVVAAPPHSGASRRNLAPGTSSPSARGTPSPECRCFTLASDRVRFPSRPRSVKFAGLPIVGSLLSYRQSARVYRNHRVNERLHRAWELAMAAVDQRDRAPYRLRVRQIYSHEHSSLQLAF